jgi:putative glutamine amidotransferase
MADKPLIGITTFRTDSGRGYIYLSLTESYVQAVAAGGALPVLVPLGLPEDDLDRIRGKLDGLVLSGGGDLDPALYGGIPHPSVGEIDEDRDRVELHLARKFVDAGRPLLGICRGMQLLNVALGGTLYSDIAAQRRGAIAHDLWPGQGYDHSHHMVRIEEESRLAEILGQPMVEVNSLHHQGVRDLAPGLIPTAYAPDGLIEAFELPDHPFGLAVQWHPERLAGERAMPGLFEALTRAAADGHA